MGFFFRKSFAAGPFRVNFSKSGVGLSTGVRGARISTGPRGTYLHLGRNGFYYRQKIGDRRHGSRWTDFDSTVQHDEPADHRANPSGKPATSSASTAGSPHATTRPRDLAAVYYWNPAIALDAHLCAADLRSLTSLSSPCIGALTAVVSAGFVDQIALASDAAYTELKPLLLYKLKSGFTDEMIAWALDTWRHAARVGAVDLFDFRSPEPRRNGSYGVAAVFVIVLILTGSHLATRRPEIQIEEASRAGMQRASSPAAVKEAADPSVPGTTVSPMATSLSPSPVQLPDVEPQVPEQPSELTSPRQLPQAMAERYSAEGNWKDARDAWYRRTTFGAGDPRDAHAHLMLGSAQMHLRDFVLAAESFGEAARLTPADPEPQYQLGLVHMNLGDWKEARNSFETAIAVAGSYARAEEARAAAFQFEAMRQRLWTLSGVGRRIAAKDYAQRLVDAGYLIPARIAWQNLAIEDRLDLAAAIAYAKVLIASGDTPRAIDELIRVVKLEPRDADVRLTLAKALESTNDLDGALREFQVAADVCGNCSEAVTGIARLGNRGPQ